MLTFASNVEQEVSKMREKTREEDHRFTFRKLTVSENEANDIASSLGFREEGNRWFVYRIPALSVAHRMRFERNQMQAYLPTYHSKVIAHGRTVEVERPKMLNYIFVLADQDKVERFRLTENIAPVRAHRCKDEIQKYDEIWLTVPTRQMHTLMLVAQGYEHEVEFSMPDDEVLESGDRVLVADGPFKGVKGILTQTQGKRNGKVFVNIENGYGILTKDVPDEYLKVLEFSRLNNHLTRRMQAFEKILNEAYTGRDADGSLIPEHRAALQAFLFRYSELSGLTHSSYARLMALRYAALMLLGDRQKASECLSSYAERSEMTKDSRRAARRSPTADEYMQSWMKRLQAVQVECN